MLILLACTCAGLCRPRGAAPPQAVYSATPQFQTIEGTPFSYAVNARQKVILAGGSYYLWDQGQWFASSSAEGSWRSARSVPRGVGAIECAQLGVYDPHGNYQLCVGPLPRLKHHWFWALTGLDDDWVARLQRP